MVLLGFGHDQKIFVAGKQLSLPGVLVQDMTTLELNPPYLLICILSRALQLQITNVVKTTYHGVSTIAFNAPVEVLTWNSVKKKTFGAVIKTFVVDKVLILPHCCWRVCR